MWKWWRWHADPERTQRVQIEMTFRNASEVELHDEKDKAEWLARFTALQVEVDAIKVRLRERNGGDNAVT